MRSKEPRRPGHALGALAILGLVGPSPLARAEFNAEQVFSGRNFRGGSLVQRSTGPAIAYGTHGIYYAERVGTTWVKEIVDDTVCAHSASLTTDLLDNALIAYTDATNGDLRFAARLQNGDWSIQVVDSVGHTGWQPSLALDPSGAPGIAYRGPGQEYIKYAHLRGFWNLETLPVIGTHGELSYNLAGEPAISYSGAMLQDVWLAERRGGSWLSSIRASIVAPQFDLIYAGGLLHRGDFPILSWNYSTDFSTELHVSLRRIATTLAPHAPFASDLALDPQGRLGVAFTDRNGWAGFALEGTPWSFENITTGSYAPSLAFAPNGTPQVALATNVPYLQLASKPGATWVRETIDTPTGVAYFGAVAIDPSGQPAIGFASWAGQGYRGTFRYATRVAGTWQVQVVDPTPRWNQDAELAFDGLGRPVLALATSSPYEVRMARWNGSQWDLVLVDSDGRDPVYKVQVSLAMDGADEPAIAYSRGSAGELKLARWDGSQFQLETVETSGADASASLAFDASGKPHLSYVMRGTTLRLASWDGLVWQKTDVDTGAFQNPTALALDALGNPSIAYFDRTNRVMKLATRGGTGFSIESVERIPGTSEIDKPVLRLTSAGPTLSFSATGGVHYAHRDGSTWRVEIVDGGGRFPSHAFDPAGRLQLAYVDACRGTLLLATDTGDVWVYRARVATLAPGWKALALPLDGTRDDETQPFPIASRLPGAASDPEAPGGPDALVLYRALWTGDRPARNTLKVVKSTTGGVTLSY